MRAFVASVLVTTTLVAPFALATPAPARDPIDAAEIARMEKDDPKFVELLLKGEAALAAGDVERAAGMFAQASEGAPQRSLPARRRCEALTVLGRRDEALRACNRAMGAIGSARDVRAMAAALLSGTAPLEPLDIAHAQRSIARARELAGRQPLWPAIECDLARRLGDKPMFKHCVGVLLATSPDHHESRLAYAAAAQGERPWLRWLGLGGLLFAVIGTLAHASHGLSSRSRRARRLASAVLIPLCVVATSVTARAEDAPASPVVEEDAPTAPIGMLSSKFPIDVQNPSASVPAAADRDRDPLQFGYFLMDLSILADKAYDAKNYAEAIRFYEAIVKAVPERSVGYSKLCKIHLAMGNRSTALSRCREALSVPGATVEDYTRFAQLLLDRSPAAAPGDADLKDVQAVIDHLETQGDPALKAASLLECELGTRIADPQRLAQCTGTLVRLAPDEPSTIMFQWALAMLRKDRDAVLETIQHARQVELPSAAIARFERGAEDLLPFWKRLPKQWRAGAGIALLALAFLMLWVTWRRSSGRSGSPPSASLVS